MPNIDLKKPQYRELKISNDAINAAARTVSIAFSSEAPVDRYFGIEILDHKPSSVRLERLRDGGPLLLNHDPDDQIGVVESVEIDSDGVGRAVVRLGKGERADEIFNDIVDGIRRKVSVGYQIHAMNLESNKDGVETYRVTDWEPLEISIVSIPADNSVGVGRSHEEPKPSAQKEVRNMSDDNTTSTATQAAPAAAPVVDTRAIENEANKKMLERIKEMQSIGKTFEQFDGVNIANQFIAEGRSVSDLQAAILERAGKKPMKTAEIGMDDKDVRKFSVVRLLNALANPRSAEAQRDAGFEFEVSEAARQQMGKEARGGATIPLDVLKRDLVVGTATAGGNLVATDLLAGSFIDMLRNRLAVFGAGARLLTGLNGNVAIPKQTGSATAYWVAENNAPTESQQTVGQVTLSPKTVGAYTDIGRRLMLQSSVDVEAMVRNDLNAVLALAIDAAAINGSGTSNQPTGLISTAGIGSVAGGTNGATVSWANLVALESAVAIGNADVGSLGYLTNAKQRGVMKSTPKISGYPQYLWENGDTPINGYKCGVSNQIPSNLTKGTASGICSAILFGNWDDLIIGMWGGLDLLVDPYTGGNAGTVRVSVLQDVDVAVRNAVSFAAMLDAL